MNAATRSPPPLATSGRIEELVELIDQLLDLVNEENIALAMGLLQADRHLVAGREREGWIYAGGADGAKTLLATIASTVHRRRSRPHKAATRTPR